MSAFTSKHSTPLPISGAVRKILSGDTLKLPSFRLPRYVLKHAFQLTDKRAVARRQTMCVAVFRTMSAFTSTRSTPLPIMGAMRKVLSGDSPAAASPYLHRPSRRQGAVA